MIVLQVLRTFIYLNVPTLSDVLRNRPPPLEKLFFIGAEELGQGGPAKNRKTLPKKSKKYYQKIEEKILQKNRKNITKIIEKIFPKNREKIPKKSKNITKKSKNVTRKIEKTLQEK